MEDKLAGINNPETREWIRNFEVITKSNVASKEAYACELNKRCKSKNNKWWKEKRRGSNRRSKWLAGSICKIFTYYTQYFTETELSLIFGVLGDNHNTNLALDKLIDVRILRKSKDEGGSEVYVLVDMLKMHLRYEVDAEIEESIGKDLQRLYREGNLIIESRKNSIESRKKQKRDDNNNDVQNSNSEEEEEENDDNDNDVQNSDSGEEEEENDDDDNDVQNSASEEEEEEDEEEDVNIFEV